jgi:hypothetical protein
MQGTTDRERIQDEALARATRNKSWANYPAIFEGFTAKGIPEGEIEPRVNVFTFHAWKALGRYVRRGEHGVKVTTWIKIDEKRDERTGEVVRESGRRPKTAVVFHVSQTEPLANGA